MTKSTLFSLAASSVGVGTLLGGADAGDDRPDKECTGEFDSPLPSPSDRDAVGARGGSKFSTRGRLIGSSLPGFSLNLSPPVDGLISGRLVIPEGRVERCSTCGFAPGKGEGKGGESSSRSRLFDPLIPLDAGIRGPLTIVLGGGSTGRGSENRVEAC